MYVNFRKKKISKEIEQKCELLWLSKQVLFDLKKEYRRAIGNSLFNKAIKTKIHIDSVTAEIENIKKQIEEIEAIK